MLIFFCAALCKIMIKLTEKSAERQWNKRRSKEEFYGGGTGGSLRRIYRRSSKEEEI